MYRFFHVLFFSALIGGCQLRPQLPDDAIYQRGLISLDGGDILFQPCGRTQWQQMAEIPDLLRQEYLRFSAGREGLPVYIEGWGADGTDGWRVLEPRVIGGDLSSCDERFAGVSLYAAGLEPPWSVMLGEDSLVFNEPQRLRTLVFDKPERMREGEIWRWYQRLSDRKSGLDIALEVVVRPCRDGQGNWYALSAQLDLEGSVFNGCARYGDLPRLALASHYRTAAGAYLRDLHLLMQADGDVRLVADNHDGQPLQPRAGRWRFLSSDRVLLELERPGAAGKFDTQLWQVRGDGALVLLNDDPALGRGLELQPTGRILQWPEGRAPLP
ncbi:hypothetical protein GCM10011352_29100 [Marinobacterium zhoushanense]|uniref:Uncharacterized protein n=1 Tax=Marinobacterium zhoushanense TaxID=1679163 RepID=A0ABQ1KN68_9GAMM|nr:hypothetical protein [Marinobacterium zhoushanense]GGC01164.1 hypothetical protein GCM10011352_29100 [Marinobacterium zhoushanense]